MPEPARGFQGEFISLLKNEGIGLYQYRSEKEMPIDLVVAAREEKNRWQPRVDLLREMITKVKNSAHTLGRQLFSAAHELYHYYYDKELNGTICDTFKFKNQRNKSETLADYFAVHFLMPEDAIYKFFNIVGDQSINVNKIIKAQNFFKVSFKAMLVRLRVLGFIDEKQYCDFSDIHLNSTFAKLGYSRELIRPTNETYIPQSYIEVLNDNFTEGKISETSYKKYLTDAGLSIEDLKIEEEVDDIVEESSFDY